MPLGEHARGGVVAVRPGRDRAGAGERLRGQLAAQAAAAGVGRDRQVDLGAPGQREALVLGEPQLRALEATVLEMERGRLVQGVVAVDGPARPAYGLDDGEWVGHAVRLVLRSHLLVDARGVGTASRCSFAGSTKR